MLPPRVSLFLIILFVSSAVGQSLCPNDNILFESDLIPAPCVSSCILPGSYSTYQFTLGERYIIKTCGTIIDTVINVYEDSGSTTILASDDDGCGSASAVLFEPPYTGTYRVVVDLYQCLTSDTCVTLDVCQTSQYCPNDNYYFGTNNAATGCADSADCTPFGAYRQVILSADVEYEFSACSAVPLLSSMALYYDNDNSTVPLVYASTNSPSCTYGSSFIYTPTISGAYRLTLDDILCPDFESGCPLVRLCPTFYPINCNVSSIQFPPQSVDLTTGVCMQECMNPGEYSLVGMNGGTQYYFTTCGSQDDLRLAVYDQTGVTQLTANVDSPLCPNQLYQSTILFTPPTTSFYRVQLDTKLCVGTETCQLLKACEVKECPNDNTPYLPLDIPSTPGCVEQPCVYLGEYLPASLEANTTYSFDTCNDVWPVVNLMITLYDDLTGELLAFSRTNNGECANSGRSYLEFTTTSARTVRINVDSLTCEYSQGCRALRGCNIGSTTTSFITTESTVSTSGSTGATSESTTDTTSPAVPFNGCPNDNLQFNPPLRPGRNMVECDTAVCILPGEYKVVEVTAGLNYTFHTCGSTFDTALTLYDDTTGVQVIRNDDATDGPCAGTKQSYVEYTPEESQILRLLVDHSDQCEDLEDCATLTACLTSGMESSSLEENTATGTVSAELSGVTSLRAGCSVVLASIALL